MEDTVLPRMVEQLKRLPSPRSYFRGVDQGSSEIPRKILMFRRKQAEHLGQEHHYHYRFVLLINLQRTGVMAVDGNNIPVQPGEAILVFPHQFHHYVSPKSGPLEWLFVTFELDQFEGYAALRDRSQAIPDVAWGFLDRLLHVYLEVTGNSPQANPAALGPLVSVFLNELLRQPGHAPVAAAVPRPSVLDRVVRLIWDRFDQPLPLPELAHEVALSESHLRALFRTHMGQSLGAYIQRIRMNRARSFLVDTDRNVSQVAQDCGYDSIHAFSRAFRRHHRMSPSDYRKRNRNAGGARRA
jgi:AraC-like DNA-binding protein/mannose-6-phosphate isomerase-like protein (cupin superfamily)